MGSTVSTTEKDKRREFGKEQLRKFYTDGSKVVSLSSVSKLTTNIVNATPYTLEMYWLNYLGEPTSYGLLHKGSKMLMITYNTHPWVFKCVEDPNMSSYIVVDDTKQQVLFPSRDVVDRIIHLADEVPWSIHTHHRFKSEPAFCQQVKTLLMIQNRLHRHGPMSDDPSSPLDDHLLKRSRSCVTTSLNSLALASRSNPGRISPGDQCPPIRTVSSVASQTCFSFANICTGRSISDGGRSLSFPAASLPHVPSYLLPLNAADLAQGLHDIPADVLVEVISFLAPSVPDVAQPAQEDMELPPEHLMETHIQAMAQIQQQIQAVQQLQQQGPLAAGAQA